MADAEYRVRLVIEDDVQGANDSVAAMDRVEKKVDDIRAKLGKQSEAEKPLAEIPPAADAATKKLTELNAEAAKPGMKPVAENAQQAKAGLEQAAEAARQAIGGVQAAGGSFEGLGRVLKTLREESEKTSGSTASLATVLTRLGPVVAAALAAFNAGKWMAELSASFDEGAQEAKEKSEAIANAIHRAGETKVKFDGIREGVTEAIAELQKLMAEIDRTVNMQQRVGKAELTAKQAGIDAGAASASASAASEEERVAIKARAEAEKKAAELTFQSASIEARLQAEKEKRAAIEKSLAEYNESLAPLVQARSAAEARYTEVLELLIASGMTMAQARQDPRAAGAAEEASRTKASADEASSKLDPQGQALRTQLEEVLANMRQLEAERQTNESQRHTEGIQQGRENQQAVIGMTAKLEELKQELAAARVARAAAQATQGPAEQTAAYNKEASLEQQVRDMEAKIAAATSTTKRVLSDLGSAAMEGVASAERDAATAKAKMEQAQASASESTTTLTASVVGAAGEFTKATTGSMATMTGAVDNLGKQITSGFTEVGTQVTRIAGQTAAQIQSMQGQIDRLSVTANAALDNSAVALNRINSGR